MSSYKVEVDLFASNWQSLCHEQDLWDGGLRNLKSMTRYESNILDDLIMIELWTLSIPKVPTYYLLTIVHSHH
jgi:hypothetical protein